MNPWDQHSNQVMETVRRATTELFLAAARNPAMTIPEFTELCNRLVQKYHRVAVGSAVIALDTSRKTLEVWDSLPPPVPADPVPYAQVRGSVAWAVRTSNVDLMAATRLFAGPLGRLVRQGARDTIWESCRVAGTRYCRVPGVKACAFCLMLASRGAVYSKETVLTVGRGRRPGPGSKHRRPEGATYHDYCDCQARESVTDADLPQIVRDLEQEWSEVTAPNMTPNQMRKAWEAYIAETRPDNTSFHPTRWTRSAHWVPEDAIRIERKVSLRQTVIDGTDKRRLPPSLYSLERDGLILPPGQTLEPKGKVEREVQEKEQEIIDWLYDNGAEKISKVMRYADLPEGWENSDPNNLRRPSLQTPDLVVDEVPTEAKTLVSIKTLKKRLGKASEQARTVIYDMRGVDVDKDTVMKHADDAIREYGDRIDRMVIIGKGFTITWPQ